MNDAAQQLPDIWQTIEALRQRGAERSAAVRFHYLGALAQRAAQLQGQARHLLDAKLAAAVAACEAKLQQTQPPADQPHTTLPPVPAQAQTLGELARACGQHGPAIRMGEVAGTMPPRSELKTVQQHRKTWSRLSAEKQLSQALEQPPTNPGPINSHMLVLRSVALMRDTSPDYLSRFMTYVDTLLLLEQNEAIKPAPAPSAAKGEARAKPKVTRGPVRKPAAPKK